MPSPTWLWWSSGKDSAWTLHVLQESPEYDVTALVTTVTAEFDRVAMHGVRRELLEAQGRATGLPLQIVELPFPCSNQAYEAAVDPLLDRASAAGIEKMAFGDLHLDDVRAYREALLDGTDIEPLFPIWGEDTGALARRMVANGIEAYVTCIDPRALPAEYAGRAFDNRFLESLPEAVDPCGERGEFHTFVWSAPVFSAPIAVQLGDTVERDGFVFVDLLPAGD